MEGAFLIFAIIFWVLPIWVGHQIGKPKGRAGGVWGLLLGWIGVIIVALLPPTHLSPGVPGAGPPALMGGPMYRECPHCKESMRRDASICPHCHRESRPWQLYEGRWWVRGADSDTWHWLNEQTNEWVRAEEQGSASTAPA